MDLAGLAAKRIKYVSHIRRAFLLRAHPDRFRSHPASLRKIQAEAIQSFQERISSSDFSQYKSTQSDGSQHHHGWEKLSFHLEKKDGSLKKCTVQLDKNAEQILEGIAAALKSTGMTVMKAPPPLQQVQDSVFDHTVEGGSFFTNHNNMEMNRMQSILRSAAAKENQDGRINNIFDVNTRKGRDLTNFLENLDVDEIERRKASRIDASAAALVARQLFKFQSIDGTGLGWSSESLAKCLTSLTKLYDEHHSKFKIDTFYPFRLILSNDESQEKVDLFGGTIMLNPGSTEVQNLETLMSVNDISVKELVINRNNLAICQDAVQNALNIKIKKGYSCSSREYYEYMVELSDFLHTYTMEKEDVLSHAVALGRIQVVVETAYVCRRATVNNLGEIRVSVGMTSEAIVSSIRSCRQEAHKKVDEEDRKKTRGKELAKMVQYNLGASRIFKGRISVSSDQYLSSLTALLNLPEEEVTFQAKQYTEGNNIGIIGSGRSCHLGDDGSILIPCDWR
jgi:hypothetical protein